MEGHRYSTGIVLNPSHSLLSSGKFPRSTCSLSPSLKKHLWAFSLSLSGQMSQTILHRRASDSSLTSSEIAIPEHACFKRPLFSPFLVTFLFQKHVRTRNYSNSCSRWKGRFIAFCMWEVVCRDVLFAARCASFATFPAFATNRNILPSFGHRSVRTKSDTPRSSQDTMRSKTNATCGEMTLRTW